jgi:hypothetical protein
VLYATGGAAFAVRANQEEERRELMKTRHLRMERSSIHLSLSPKKKVERASTM